MLEGRTNRPGPSRTISCPILLLTAQQPQDTYCSPRNRRTVGLIPRIQLALTLLRDFNKHATTVVILSSARPPENPRLGAMDMTPPLTRSPASTPKTHCPSEADSSDYPSPGLFEQHYKVSACDVGRTCSMAPAQPSNQSSPHLDAATQAAWSPPSVLHPALTTASMANVMATEYDTLAPYESPMSVSYQNDVYTARGQHSTAATLPVTRSPVPSMARVALLYPPLSDSVPESPRMRPEDMSSEYGQVMEGSQYPSPSLANTPYSAGMGSGHSLPPLGTPPAPQPSTGYALETALAPWARPGQYAGEPEQLYPGAGIQSSALLPVRHEAQRPTSRVGDRERPRRAPRRLTTKEEANFQCDVKGCGKFFSRSYNFKAHMETHRERREFPFRCMIGDCDKKFVRKTDLQRHHQSVHMKERNHGCEFCGRMFARRDTLKR